MKRIFSIITRIIFSLALLVGFYFLSAFGLSRIATAKEITDNTDITIYLLSNGVHTDIVLPATTPLYNWKNIADPKYTASKDSTLNYIAFGWGNKSFYLETPTWADLTFCNAFEAAVGLGKSAMHITYYNTMHENKHCKALQISSQQYIRLVTYIQQSFSYNIDGHSLPINTDAMYGIHDVFYEASGRYSLFKTCNTWANNALKSCGQKACVWTPFESGIFYHYK